MKITLCGSTKFRQTFEEMSFRLTVDGHIVYGLGCFGREKEDTGKDGNIIVTEDQKMMLDLVHLAKIEESQAILVLNVHDYIGYSTSKEIMWAKIREKTIYWLETPSHEHRWYFKIYAVTIWPQHQIDCLPEEDDPSISP